MENNYSIKKKPLFISIVIFSILFAVISIFYFKKLHQVQFPDFAKLNRDEIHRTFYDVCNFRLSKDKPTNTLLETADKNKQPELKQLFDDYHTKTCNCRVSSTIDTLVEYYGFDEILLNKTFLKTYKYERNFLLNETNDFSNDTNLIISHISKLKDAKKLEERTKNFSQDFLTKSLLCEKNSDITEDSIHRKIKEIVGRK